MTKLSKEQAAKEISELVDESSMYLDNLDDAIFWFCPGMDLQKARLYAKLQDIRLLNDNLIVELKQVKGIE